MNILVLGSGGREHTFVWKISQSKNVGKIYAAPGNAGTSQLAQNIPVDINDFPAVKDLILKFDIGMVVVGPEEPLVRGIRDYFKEEGLLDKLILIGPDKKGASLEGSKDFSKKFMEKYGVPTAKALTVNKENLSEGLSFLETLSSPYVLKADGLAAGKGVIISPNLEEAKSALKTMLDGQFGAASQKVLIEEFLDGIELSVFVLTDGINYKILPEAKDYKRIGEGDTGPNTGGMGAVSPVLFADKDFMSKVEERVIKPTVKGLQEEGMDYVGFIFIGLMNIGGEPFVIEYNVRMGDPETQAVLPRLDSDLLELFKATANNSLNEFELKTSNHTTTTVVAAAGGYPGSYEKGKVISGLDNANNATVFHAGTKESDGLVITNGGRVIAVTGMSSSIEGALEKSYNALSEIDWEGMNFRKDIGQDLIAFMSKS
ncbi:phosphoribosylamine--glycine ligase [Reichenbachiella sp. MALMAid0571]|uniref:phosphoribosylamine--glycine ligase n=1 Tax=Reichenbachiella sp. MALMAid0571 TaxID=3143939 RepID=UPI0032DE5FE6